MADNTSAESPKATQTKKWSEARARDKKAREEAKAAEAEANKPKPPREIDYVLVRHLARSPRARTMRAARAGHRRQGVLLDDGTRIRKKGRQRLTEVSLDVFVRNHARILEFVQVGTLELVDPADFQPIPYAELLEIAKKHVKGELDTDSRVPQDAPMGSVEENTAPAPKDAPPPAAPEAGKGDVYYEEELKKMTRADLNNLASSNFGVNNPEGMPNKQAVVDAIMSAGGGE